MSYFEAKDCHIAKPEWHVIYVTDFPGRGPWARLWAVLRVPYNLVVWIIRGKGRLL